MQLTTLFLPCCTLLATLALHLLALAPAPALAQGADQPTVTPPAASFGLSAPDYSSKNWSSDFTLSLNQSTHCLLQRGEYRRNGMGVLLEMGDIVISGPPSTGTAIPGRGGRLTVRPAGANDAVNFETFATTGVNARGLETSLVGASGEIWSAARTGRFRTTYFSRRETLNARPMLLDERRGDVLALFAGIDPFAGKLAAEAEADFSSFDSSSADDVAPVGDAARRVKIFGNSGPYRYSALYEKSGPNYRVPGSESVKRDAEGVALSLAAESERHAVELKLSRYNDNTANNDLYPRLNKYEGLVDYSFKGVQTLPMGVRYTKTVTESEREPVGSSPTEKEDDAVAGRMRYLGGKWEVGVEASYKQRSDKIRGELDSTAAAFSLLPKFVVGRLTVAPEFSCKRSRDYVESTTGDQFAVNLGINGSGLQRKLDYQLSGGYNREGIGLVGSGKETVNARIKAAFPLVSLFRDSVPPTVGIRGEYSGIVNQAASERRSNTVSLLLSLEGATDTLFTRGSR